MADDLRAFDKWFDAAAWPSAPCPVCKVGDLHPVRGEDGKSKITSVESAASARMHDHPNWDPMMVSGVFHGVLICARPLCAERVVVSGDYAVDMGYDDRETYWTDHYRLRFAWPALPLMNAPAGTPEAVQVRIEDASRVLWADPNSGANALRRAVEAVLDHQRVNKTTARKAGGRRRLNTQERITEFKKKEPVAADALEAVKWAGNQGSHGGDEMTASMVIESAEYLDHALRKLYDRREAEITRKIADVNKRRKLRKQT